LFEFQPLLEFAPKSDDADPNANRRNPEADGRDGGLPEGLC